MRQKGDIHTNEAQLTADLLLEKLSSLNGITSKKMFGGHGIFHNGKMFGMVDSKGNCALKADGTLEKEYQIWAVKNMERCHTTPSLITSLTPTNLLAGLKSQLP